MKQDNLDKDYLPDPPTPNNKALPIGYLKTLVILEICSQASKKRIKFVAILGFSVLYSS